MLWRKVASLRKGGSGRGALPLMSMFSDTVPEGELPGIVSVLEDGGVMNAWDLWEPAFSVGDLRIPLSLLKHLCIPDWGVCNVRIALERHFDVWWLVKAVLGIKRPGRCNPDEAISIKQKDAWENYLNIHEPS